MRAMTRIVPWSVRAIWQTRDPPRGPTRPCARGTRNAARQHPGGLLLIEQAQPHEQPEHDKAERLSPSRGLVHRPPDERPVGPEAAVGDEEMFDRDSRGLARAVCSSAPWRAACWPIRSSPGSPFVCASGRRLPHCVRLGLCSQVKARSATSPHRRGTSKPKCWSWLAEAFL